MSSHRFMNTSVPKLTVPQVRLAPSGPASRTASRSASLSVTAPPEETWTTRSVASRTASRGPDVAEVERGLRLGVADVDVDHGGPGRFARLRGSDELVDGDWQRGRVGFSRFRTGWRDGDQRPGSHASHRVTTTRREGVVTHTRNRPRLTQTVQRSGGVCR